MSISDHEAPITVLRDVMDERYPKRAPIAEAVTNCDESLLSKKVNGVGGRDFGLRDLGALACLDRDLVGAWLTRYGKMLGYDVRPISTQQVAEEFMELFARMEATVKLYRIAAGDRNVKAELPAREPARKVG